MRAAIYCRVSTLDQNPQTQLLDLQQLASQRGFEVVQVYTDHGMSGTRQRRPGLDQMLADARRREVRCCALLGVRSRRTLGEALPGSPRRADPPERPVRQLP